MKLNVGSNEVRLEGWINIDIEGMADVKHDARTRFPYEDNSVDFIFSEHFIEHLNEPEGKFFLAECFRMLKPGGVVRTSTFNILTIADNLIKNRWDEYNKELYGGMFSDRTGMEFFNLAVYEANFHKWMYNPDEMIRMLSTAGFTQFKVCEKRISEHPELCNLEWRCNSDCVVEATK